ncbi:MAG: AmpG family muropeptide MFS transporter [Pseudomonadota bacterium]
MIKNIKEINRYPGTGKKLLWIGLLYFAEGLPFGIIIDTLPVYFRLNGLSLKDIGLMSLVFLPWSIKFLWAPAVDFIGRRKYWIAATQAGMAFFTVALIGIDPSKSGILLFSCMFGLAILSATQDIAIDAYSIEILEQHEMGAANGVRVSTYRIALIVAGGLLVAVGGWVGWNVTFLITALFLGSLSCISLFLPSTGYKRPIQSLRTVVAPVFDLLRRPDALWVAMFILTFKLGDLAMGPMVKPFWVDRGLSTTEIGLITGTFGIVASITGALIGGSFTTKYGIFRGLWILGIFQAVSNLGYATVATYPDTGHLGVYLASIVESFCGGLGTASFLAFLMSICKKEFAATQYAILSALFGLTRSFSGATSGLMTSYFGYSSYFLITFFMACPAYLMLKPVKRWIDST